jgi:hypothetical protein
MHASPDTGMLTQCNALVGRVIGSGCPRHHVSVRYHPSPLGSVGRSGWWPTVLIGDLHQHHPFVQMTQMFNHQPDHAVGSPPTTPSHLVKPTLRKYNRQHHHHGKQHVSRGSEVRRRQWPPERRWTAPSNGDKTQSDVKMEAPHLDRIDRPQHPAGLYQFIHYLVPKTLQFSGPRLGH